MPKERGKNPTLKYYKLYNWAKTLIVSGVLKKGQKLPSENVLTRKFDYSRQTVRQALELLEQEGLIERVRGSGTYVAYDNASTAGSKPKVGLILSYFSEYLFPSIYDGIEDIMKEEGYEIDVQVTKNRLNEEALYLESFLRSDVKGLIVEGTKSSFPNQNQKFYRELEKRNIPVIFIHNHYPNMPFPSIEMQDRQGAKELTEYLFENGHRRIGGIFKYDDYQGMERYHGFIDAMSERGYTVDDDAVMWYSTKDFEYKFSKKSLGHFLQRLKDCTALMIYNDEIGGSFLEYLETQHISVPGQLSIVSFDDAMLAEDHPMRLKSVVHPKYELGSIAGRSLVRMMKDPDWKIKDFNYRFPVKMNNGNSVKKL